MLKEGFTYQQQTTVEQSNTAAEVGSGDLQVYGTPAMIAFIENTAVKAVAEELDEEQTTVGTKVDINHLNPTPVGETVTCTVELIEVDGSQLKFDVTVEDEHNQIGVGTHIRYIVNQGQFMDKIER